MNCPAHMQRPGGYTLIELVMVLLIIGLLSAVAVPRFANASAGHRADAAAKRIARDLTMMRETARGASATRTITFYPLTDKYTISAVDDLDHNDQDYHVHLDESPYRVKLVSAVFNADAVLKIDGYGVPDSGGTVVISAGYQKRTITYNAESGEAQWQ